MATQVESWRFAEELETKTCVVCFTAEWCSPCKVVKPILKELEDNGAEVYFVDIDQQEILAEKFSIRSVPTVIFFREGKPVEQIVGAVARHKFLDAAEKLR